MVNPARRTLAILGVFALGLGAAGPARAAQPIPVPTAADCAALLTVQLSFKDTGALDYRYAGGFAAHNKSVEPVLTKAVVVPATATVPEYCRVEGGIPTGNAAEGHCAGGVRGAAVGWDKLPALVDWVENGHAPDQIVVTQDAGTTTPEGNERIICPWPLQPTYIGPEGTENTPANWVASNFACRAEPHQGHHHHEHDADHDGGFRLPWWR